MKNNIDQLVLVCGENHLARQQSAIGKDGNPGLFLMFALAAFDLKFKNDSVESTDI